MENGTLHYFTRPDCCYKRKERGSLQFAFSIELNIQQSIDKTDLSYLTTDLLQHLSRHLHMEEVSIRLLDIIGLKADILLVSLSPWLRPKPNL